MLVLFVLNEVNNSQKPGIKIIDCFQFILRAVVTPLWEVTSLVLKG